MKIKDKAMWERALSKDPDLKALVKKAGCTYERACQLNGCIAVNCGKEVIKSDAERELAMYMFNPFSDSYDIEIDEEDMQDSHITGRIIAAKRARISTSDL